MAKTSSADVTKLSAKQEEAVLALLTNEGVDNAARAVGVAPRTLYRWLNEPAFDEGMCCKQPTPDLVGSLTGAGPVLVPRLILAFGTDRQRYESAYEMQGYSGITPVKEASGKSIWIHFRFACPKFLRQTFHEFALHSIGQSEWAKAYYEHLRRDVKKDRHPAVRSLAFKWIRIIYRCWKEGQPYDENIYLKSLRRRGSLLPGIAELATGTGWKTVGGFQKFCGEKS